MWIQRWKGALAQESLWCHRMVKIGSFHLSNFMPPAIRTFQLPVLDLTVSTKSQSLHGQVPVGLVGWLFIFLRANHSSGSLANRSKPLKGEPWDCGKLTKLMLPWEPAWGAAGWLRWHRALILCCFCKLQQSRPEETLYS